MLYFRLANMSYCSPVVSICNGNTSGSCVVVQLVGTAWQVLLSVIARHFDAFLEHVQKNALGNL